MDWTISIDDHWIAWLTFDCAGARVNTFSERALRELDAKLDALAADERIKAVAVRSGKPEAFIAGADVDELALIHDADDARAKTRAGLAVFEKLASLPVPTVAVIHGACMGGGLELALACTWRLVTDHPKTILALPEVKLGVIPGWGGTQRLPRLIGLAPALSMILPGRNVVARKARRMGLADGIVTPAFHEEQTRAFVEKAMRGKGKRAIEKKRRRARSRTSRIIESTALGRAIVCGLAARAVRKKAGDLYPAPLEAARVVRRTAGGPLRPEGFVEETEAFARLACTNTSRNLVRLFQMSQRAKKLDVDAPETPARHVGVVGAGIMGGGIAWATAGAGMTVRMKDVAWSQAAAGMKAASTMFGAQVKRRRMTKGEMNLAMHRIAPTVGYEGFGNLDLVIEAVVEDLAIKRAVLAEVEARVSKQAVIATNTSSLPLKDLASALDRPKRFVGLHFFNPVNRMPLVEIVAHGRTSRKAIAVAVDYVQRIGKTPVVVGDCPGFLVNRILLPYLIESASMVEEGVPIERIDRALTAFGMPMGPLALVDEVGVDVGYKVARVLEQAYGERMHVSEVLTRIAEDATLLGRKSGRGFYLYDGRRPVPNPAIAAMAPKERHLSRELSDEEIVDRAVLVMVNEAARCLDEGIVESPEQLDLAMVMGTGFAPFRGGLLRYADDRGVARVRKRLEELALNFGDRFEPAPLLAKVTANGGSFHGHGKRRERVARPHVNGAANGHANGLADVNVNANANGRA